MTFVLKAWTGTNLNVSLTKKIGKLACGPETGLGEVVRVGLKEVTAIARLMDKIGSQGPQIVDSQLDEFASLRPITSFMGRNPSSMKTKTIVKFHQ
jgi:hypothetical protein